MTAERGMDYSVLQNSCEYGAVTCKDILPIHKHRGSWVGKQLYSPSPDASAYQPVLARSLF